jgi:crotonobetainyl-CoA:carnitine CoA-transferase CaiB-like acyl-CoA transferase
LVGEPPPVPAGSPRLGEHTREVLGSLLGLSGAEIDGLAADGII